MEDTIYFYFSDKHLPIVLQEIDINSDIGPYDDDGATKLSCAPANVRPNADARSDRRRREVGCYGKGRRM